MDSIITVNNISFFYKNLQALKDISFLVNPGDFIALMGVNGAGKSTLLNILHGTLSPCRGEVYFNDKYISRKNPYASIGFSAQRLVADWFLTARDNVFMGCILAGISHRKAKAMTEDALNQVGLIDKADCQLDTLSGGQQQRIQIARSIVHKPQLYILDEPTTGLDAQYAENLFSFLEKERCRGKTIIVSSHDLYLLEKYCTKLIYLEKGKMNYFGALDEFLKKNAPVMRYYIYLKEDYRPNDNISASYFIRTHESGKGSNCIEIELKKDCLLSEALAEIAQKNDIQNIKNLAENGLRSFFTSGTKE